MWKCSWTGEQQLPLTHPCVFYSLVSLPRGLMPRTLDSQITLEKTPSYFVTREAASCLLLTQSTSKHLAAHAPKHPLLSLSFFRVPSSRLFIFQAFILFFVSFFFFLTAFDQSPATQKLWKGLNSSNEECTAL